MSTAHKGPRTYGNWRRPVQPGIASLGLLGTGLVFGGTVCTLLAWVLIGLGVAILAALLFATIVGLLAVRDRHGRSGLVRLGTRLAWRRTRRAGANLYRSGPTGRAGTDRFQLPGLAAPSRVEEYTDAFGRPFAMIAHPHAGTFTVVLRGEPQGAALVDPEQVDQWVAHYGTFLAMAGQALDLVGASVTIETTPDTGSRLRREISGSRSPDAPHLAAAVLDEIAATYPAMSSSTAAFIALTYTSAGRIPEDVARDLGASLGGFTAELSASGAGDVTPIATAELAEVIRSCYDPSATEVFDSLRANGEAATLRWEDVGPTGTQAAWDYYRHDTGWSRTWAMSSPPRGVVSSTVLSALLQPDPKTMRKRITFIYRPHDPERARSLVERDLRTADFRTSGSRPSARDTAAQRAATQIAEEEARGAGLIDFGMLVTTTVARASDLDAASVAVSSASAQARVQLRVVHGSQDSAFAAALPLGLVVPMHLKVPTWISESL